MTMTKLRKNFLGHLMSFFAVLAVYHCLKQAESEHKFFSIAVYVAAHIMEIVQRLHNRFGFNVRTHGTYFFRVGFYSILFSMVTVIAILFR